MNYIEIASRFRLHSRESFRYEYDFSQLTGKWTFSGRNFALAAARFAGLQGRKRSGAGEEYCGALEYLQRLDRHRHEFPFEELRMMAEALQCWLDSGEHEAQLVDHCEWLRRWVIPARLPELPSCPEPNPRNRMLSFSSEGAVRHSATSRNCGKRSSA
jgi:hypothetical protein